MLRLITLTVPFSRERFPGPSSLNGGITIGQSLGWYGESCVPEAQAAAMQYRRKRTQVESDLRWHKTADVDVIAL